MVEETQDVSPYEYTLLVHPWCFQEMAKRVAEEVLLSDGFELEEDEEPQYCAGCDAKLNGD